MCEFLACICSVTGLKKLFIVKNVLHFLSAGSPHSFSPQSDLNSHVVPCSAEMLLALCACTTEDSQQRTLSLAGVGASIVPSPQHIRNGHSTCQWSLLSLEMHEQC